MRIAIIGSGISGLAAAYILTQKHDITVYEKNDYIGGHSRTIEVEVEKKLVPIDTGFIVFNKKNYPYLTSLLDHLKVKYNKSNMSFGASLKKGSIEYGTQNLNSIFAMKSNIFNIKFWLMLKDIFKFYRQAKITIQKNMTVKELLDKINLGQYFREYFLLPMAGSIWSCKPLQILDFPAHSLITFFDNHGLLSISNQPQWYSILGGSKEYVKKLTKSFVDKIHISRAASEVIRNKQGVTIIDEYGKSEQYDQVIFACHSDQVLQILSKPKAAELEILQNIKYQRSKVVLHKDDKFMPIRKSCWSSWVYLSEKPDNLTLTYWMNNLQKLNCKTQIFVTVNPNKQIKQGDIFNEYEFEHPLFDLNAIKAQEKLATIQGKNNSWFAGAYNKYGFHEDGLLSAVNIAKKLEVDLPWQV
ncbi:MAG: FAD-dependent oxidoreductase [Rickettsiaceae bacterium]|nr:FAD-dependent oxidoreductase [Rickettsiaceae bacterium]